MKGTKRSTLLLVAAMIIMVGGFLQLTEEAQAFIPFCTNSYCQSRLDCSTTACACPTCVMWDGEECLEYQNLPSVCGQCGTTCIR